MEERDEPEEFEPVEPDEEETPQVARQMGRVNVQNDPAKHLSSTQQ